MSNLENAQRLQQWIGEGKSMEALNEFYHENVQVYEMPTGECRNGREEQRKAVQEWFGMVKERHDGGCNSVMADEANNVTCAESWVEVTTQDGNRMKMEEVAVQKWQDGKIIEEKFYYNMPAPPQS
ncbi:MAG: nuclear transport factor 2 family protein [Saprospiraceae bacterium]|nr:nuclear transport factor 2 family protein [Saprospiraceae bacterium]